MHRYFLALAILGLVFFCIYMFCVLPKYAHMEAPSEDLELEDVLEVGVPDLTESEDILEDSVRDLTGYLPSRRISSSFQWRKVLTVISVTRHLYPPLKKGQRRSRLKSE